MGRACYTIPVVFYYFHSTCQVQLLSRSGKGKTFSNIDKEPCTCIYLYQL